MTSVPHVLKFGAKWGFAHDETLRRVVFTEGFPAGATHAYNVERSSFDEMLLEAAHDAGAVVRRNKLAHLNGTPQDGRVEVTVDGRLIRASYLIDASGRAAFVSRQLGTREPMHHLRKLACFAHYTGVERDAGPAAGDLLGLMCAEGWFWIIPIDETRTSIGFVVDVDAEKRMGVPHAELLDWAIARAPQVARRCANANRVTPVSFLADFSYKCRPYAGPGYFLAGDSGAFIDPVFSTGVCLGMMTGKFAAEAIVSILRGEITADEARRDYIRKFESSSSIFFRLVEVFYKHPFREFLVNMTLQREANDANHTEESGTHRDHSSALRNIYSAVQITLGTRLQIHRAMTSILAGHIFPSPPPLKIMWRLRTLEILVALQRFLPLVPRRQTYSLIEQAPVKIAANARDTGRRSRSRTGVTLS